MVYRDTGKTDQLARFGGVKVGGAELEADPRALQRIIRAGQLDFEDFYEQE